MALWKNGARHVEEHFQRDANLTAFFSKTIPVVVTSDLGKDFKIICSEVIHTTRVDIRYMIAARLSPLVLASAFVGSQR